MPSIGPMELVIVLAIALLVVGPKKLPELGRSVGIEDGVLVVNGRQLREAYADPKSIDSVYFGPVRVKPGTVFVLGDNRANSEDSRDFGAVSTDSVIGRAVARVWPPSHWGTLH